MKNSGENKDEFDYSLTNDDSQASHDLEITHKVGIFIREQIIARHNGKLPDAKTIAVRLIVLQLILDPTDSRSLRSYSRELKCSVAWLSKVGLKFSDQIGMRASWQRISARSTYSARAKGVHDGTWKPTPKWERRQLKETSPVATAA